MPFWNLGSLQLEEFRPGIWQSLPPMEGRFLTTAAWIAFRFISSELIPLQVSEER